ncbi:MAG: hypothetical protein MHM6MM_001311 [Cercozoa sp. M6MM]
MASEQQQKVLVIGGGCAGLGTAVTLASRGVPTVLVSDEFSPLTTSDVSAGFWEPIMVKECGADAAALERTRRWSGTTFDFLTEVMHAFGTPASGCSLCSGFELLKEKNAKPHFYSDLAIGFRSLSDRDIARITNGNDYGTAFAWTTVMCDQRMYLPFLLRHFVALGGEVQQRRVSSLLEETQQYAAVVNCTGLGATDLDVGESNMLPTRGQVVKRKNRGVSHFWMTDDGPGGHCVYVLPRPDSTVVTGGTFQAGALAACVLAVLVTVAASQSTYELHVHHYIIALLLWALTPFRHWTSCLIQGACIGMFIDGIVQWGPDPLFSRHVTPRFASFDVLTDGDGSIGNFSVILDWSSPAVHLYSP